MRISPATTIVPVVAKVSHAQRTLSKQAGTPLGETYPRSSSSASFARIASRIASEI